MVSFAVTNALFFKPNLTFVSLCSFAAENKVPANLEAAMLVVAVQSCSTRRGVHIRRGCGLGSLRRPWAEEGRSLPLLPVHGRVSCSTQASALVTSTGMLEGGESREQQEEYGEFLFLFSFFASVGPILLT